MQSAQFFLIMAGRGPFYWSFERRLAGVGAALLKVNPRQALRFAETTGKFAKADRMDAMMLASVEALLGLEARPPRSANLNDFEDLHMAREALVKNSTVIRNRAKNLTLPELKRNNAEQFTQIERQMVAIEREIILLIESDPDFARRFTVMGSIPDV